MRFWQRWSTWARTIETAPARWLRAAREALLGEMPILAAGTSLFAIIATVPALAAVVSLYGMVADPQEIRTHLRGFETIVPQQVVDFMSAQLERQAQRTSGELGFQLATSIGVAIYSARSSSAAMIDALNRAYRVRELRSWLHRLGLSLLMAIAIIIGLIGMLTIVVALPGLVAAVGLKGYGIVKIARWPLLLALLFGALAAMYRYAPSPRPLGTVRHIWPGTGVATILLVLVSWGLSEWVDRVATYEAFYGAFGSVIILVLWFYLSTMALVIGGFVNAELERHSGAPAPERSMY